LLIVKLKVVMFVNCWEPDVTLTFNGFKAEGVQLKGEHDTVNPAEPTYLYWYGKVKVK
jgi:hypothetical protein